jgi:putative transposase
MPRHPRDAVLGCVYHVANYGNEWREIFSQPPDYDRFISLLREARSHVNVSVLGYCVMPTHFHLLLRPEAANALSEYMKRVTCGYACDLRFRTNSVGYGHVFQRRFRGARVTDEEHFISALRFIESNAFRARLVTRAEAWRWSSVNERIGNPAARIVAPSPVALPANWTCWVNLGQPEHVVTRLRRELRKLP